jgi:ribosomal protein S18 acetylase RimI-like enzyme
MSEITYKNGVIPNAEDVSSLYEDANWSSYTNDMPRLMEAIKNSLFIISAWDKNKLVGFVRVIGDGITIIYIQDIIVLKSYKRNGIGTYLIREVCNEYKSVRQKVLLTDDTYETRGFYESLGFISCDKGELVSFVKLG